MYDVQALQAAAIHTFTMLRRIVRIVFKSRNVESFVRKFKWQYKHRWTHTGKKNHKKKIFFKKKTSIYKPFQLDTLSMWKAHQHQKLRLATLRFLPHCWNIMSLWLDFQVCWNTSNWLTCWLTALLFIFNNERAVRKRTTWKSFHETSKKDSNIITSPT